MSGIFGIYHQDHRPVNHEHLSKMADSISHRGPDGTKTTMQDNIGFGHAMLHTTPESLQELLPFVDPETDLIITADARIDNHQEIKKKLSLPHHVDFSDSQLILYAYRELDTKSFALLMGDFAFAIWDPKKQQLICVRDYIGVKPFYYHYSPTQFLFSSEIKQLAEHPDVSLSANKSVIAEYLCCTFCNKTETLFAEINRLAAGNFLIIGTDKISTSQYWHCEPKKRIYYKSTAEYTSHFLEIFEKSVECRLRCNDVISAELSGGIDSSSVVASANKILIENNGSQLQAYSLIFPGKPFDEKKYIDAVKEYQDIPVTFINGLDYNYSTLKKQAYRTFEPPDVPNLAITTPLLTAVRNQSSRVVLTGVGGDDCFTGSGYPYLDYLQVGKFYSLFRQLHFDSKTTNEFQAAKKFFLNLSWPLILPNIKKIIACRTIKHMIPEWLNEDFITENQLRDKILNATPLLCLSNLSKLLQMRGLGSSKQYALEAIDKHTAFHQIEKRHPFLDKRIVEFALSIPDYECRRLGQIKVLLCHKKNYLLPKLIRERRIKAEFSYLINKTFQHTLFSLNLQYSFICNAGWVDKSKIGAEIAKNKRMIISDQYTSGHKSWELWFAYAIEMWCSSLLIK